MQNKADAIRTAPEIQFVIDYIHMYTIWFDYYIITVYAMYLKMENYHSLAISIYNVPSSPYNMVV